MQINEITKTRFKSFEPSRKEDIRDFAKSDLITGKIEKEDFSI